MKRRVILLLVAVLLGSGCGKKAEEQAGKPQAAQQAVAVTTMTAATADVPVMLDGVVGEIQNVTAPTISAEVAGRVTQLLVDVGDQIKKGQTLARLDSSARVLERDAAQADERRVQAQINNQEAQSQRLHELAKSNFVSKEQLDLAETQLTALREELAAARARVALAQDHIHRSVIVAPVAGRVDARLVSVGDYVKDGGALFKLADSGVLRLVMVFPEPAITMVRVGTPLKVLTAADMTRRFDAVITEVRPMIETANKGVVAYADLKEPGLNRAGGSADVQAIITVHKGAVVVPQLSLVRRPGGEMVYVIGADNKAQQRRVVSGVRLDDRIEIVEGLQAGEQIAVDGAGFLTDGVSVEIKQKQ